MAIFLTLALYRLFKAVDEGLARLVVILGALMVTPIYFLNTINDAAELLLARGAGFLSAFDKPQRDARLSWCSSACMARGYLPTRYFGDSGCSPSACWYTGRGSFRVHLACG